jgi:hypothetical protein
VLSLAFVAGIPSQVLAQSANRTILVLVKNIPGAPTPAQLVDYSNTWPHAPSPPLQAFAVKDPQAGGFLLPDRATGDFLAWLQANPNSVRRKLEDYVLMTFPSVDDVPVALAALLADPYVEDAAEPQVMDFSTAASTAFQGEPEPSQSNSYGWDDLNLAAAWQITGGGYALVAQVDMGLYTNHPLLKQWEGGSYVGGNFIQAASKDVGLTGLPDQPGFDPANVDEAKPEWIAAGACTPVNTALPPAYVGHGTHVAGLLGANGGTQTVQGTCKSCGIAMYRAAFLLCNQLVSPPAVPPV